MRFKPLISRLSPSNMSTFVLQMNPVLGKSEWVLQDQNYDYHQEIARSSYGDMLHDTERNQKYCAALKKAIEKKQCQGEKAFVLDIGTGTGLLSMMAVVANAESVTACEAFKPIAECAKKIIRDNGFVDKINLISKRSTDLRVGLGGDMEQKANLLVTEVFDTELIGEGALKTFTHAHQFLLDENSIVVPSAANIYVQLVESDFIRRWNQLQPVQVEGYADINPPLKFANCNGALMLHDLQLSQIPVTKFKLITDPVQVLRFDFSGKNAIHFQEQTEMEVSVRKAGQVNTIFMWWELEMDEEKKIILSCAPWWAHPNCKEFQWRDHWMQALYYPVKDLAVEKNELVKLISSHDEYSFWFDVKRADVNWVRAEMLRPVCTCSLHRAYSRTRLGMINDLERNQVYVKELKRLIKKETVCLSISDGSLLPLIAARLGAKKVFAVEPNPVYANILQCCIDENNMTDTVSLITKYPAEISVNDFQEMEIDLLIGEPFFQSALLPWHNLHFYFVLQHLTAHQNHPLVIVPSEMTLMAMAMEFKDLQKIISPIGECNGFNLEAFDQMIEESSNRVDCNVQPHPLWEYPGKSLSEPTQLMAFDFAADMSSQIQKIEKSISVLRDGICNGVALWVDFQFGESVISTGPTSYHSSDEYVTWDFHTRQGVHLFRKVVSVAAQSEFRINVNFEPNSGHFEMNFIL